MTLIIKPKAKAKKVMTSLKSLRPEDVQKTSEKNRPSPSKTGRSIREAAAEKTKVVSSTPSAPKAPQINNKIVKPKYVEDKSVVYKSSGYVKDLLGEEK